MGEITVEITGAGAEDAGRELLEVWRREFGVEGRRVVQDSSPRGATRGVDANTLAILGIVLAVPGALDATANLARRMELAPKVDRLIAWARARAARAPRIRLVYLRGCDLDLVDLVDLVDADPGDVVEALTKAGEGGQGGPKS